MLLEESKTKHPQRTTQASQNTRAQQRWACAVERAAAKAKTLKTDAIKSRRRAVVHSFVVVIFLMSSTFAVIIVAASCRPSRGFVLLDEPVNACWAEN
jgi:hypothetical protein